ncbi:Cu(2+)-transporting P-type ATPase [Exophiala xenobiotica]|uniref:Cu(2+)-transporting P-type ATPase n=1 Tax=Lithohypha guttulata TaxID=1690604 RepID=A0ABR0JV36_9EURO|nr:Cu(2+)-transporting P-type ATPase [Lithohypha guttulata]KAK5309391.1 Cu(2+)-transporting P-type ATPase [Exophiala xenobiotica]
MAAQLAATASAHMATTTLKVDGMTCGACTSAVEAGFKDVDGAGAVSISLIMGRAVVHHDPNTLTPDQLAEIIEDRGFDAEVLTTDMPGATPKLSISTAPTGPSLSVTTLKVDGMTCGACTSSLEAGFKDVEGVKSMSVSLLAGRAVIEHDPATISTEKLAEIVGDRGFDAEVLETKELPAAGQSGPAEPSVISDVYTTTVSIEGMTCGACTSAVEGAFKNRPGMVKFNISLLAGRAVIQHKPEQLTADQIVEAIDDSGFDAKLVSSEPEGIQVQSSSTVQLKVFGLSDATTATELENLLRERDGINSAVVSLATSRANIRYDPSATGLRTIVETVENAGYNALVADSDDNNAQLESLAKTKEIHEWKQAFLTSLSFAIPVFLISMIIPMFVPALDFGVIEIVHGLFLGDVVCCALTVPVQFGIGKRFYISAYKSLKHKSPTMDVLVVLGTSAAFFFSCFAVIVAVLIPPHGKPGTFFDTSTMMITFITLGRWLENRAKGQTSKALSNLMNLAPSMATIYEDPLYAEKLAEEWESPSSPILEKGEKFSDVRKSTNEAAQEKIIPTELIEVGDVVLLRPGDKVPADGTVTRGESYVDESMVTGEPVPILKKKGTTLVAGTVNGAGRLDFRVTRAGKDTQLSQIVNLVQEAQTSRAPIQRMADLVAGYFVPVIILLGMITFLSWMVLSHALSHPPKIFLAEQSGGKFMVCLKLCISVIVIACPCALGLATPTAVMVGTGRASQQGILVKGGAALETATRITHLVFDKTGTLTFGKLKVSRVTIQGIWNASEETRNVWWTIVGLAESGSEHPIGRSIILRAKEQVQVALEDPLPGQVGEFENRVGKGIVAQVEVQIHGRNERHEVRIGNALYLESHGLDVPSDLKPEGSKSLTGLTLIYVAIDGKFAGVLGLSDTVKPTAAAAITALHRMGISTSLVTGDTYSTAVSIADLVGIPKDMIRASVSPSQKQEIVAELQGQGEIVAMVGDGINDSPALATANVGIGLVSGSDIAIEAADIVIMRAEDLLNIPAALCLCRTIFNRIKANLLWACGYNVIGVPFAMGVFLPFGYYMPPLASAIAMMFSSISVTLSSLALRWTSRPRWLNAESLEMESGKIPVPKIGQPRTSQGVSAFGQKIWAVFDTNLGGLKRRRAGDTGDRGNYVPLRSVENV